MNKKHIFTLLGFIILSFFVLVFLSRNHKETVNFNDEKIKSTEDNVCPPFFLYDEDGNIIDPVNGINDDKPYSTKQTCGKCHNYDKITEGFHFQQGKNEKPTTIMSTRYRWVTTPGNYGGTWCSPAPLYRKLAPKKNSSSLEIDMTSFEFVTATCGYCHPGGGPLEYDRDGYRYDKRMLEDTSKFISSGENNFDGDYYKAKWDKTGVIEADCMLCHLPEYNYKQRNAMLDSLNFKWAATEGSGLGKVTGSIKSNTKVIVSYDLSKFNSDGKVSLHLVREPRTETCLNCHSKPDWKKRGYDFSPRRDVHIAAGLKCIDCHSAGSHAPHEKIRSREEHQFGKGDDPSGNVRNDLDNTVTTCEDCHNKKEHNAPLATHSWLPPLHLEKIACQTCHIPTKSVKSALVQVSDVYNLGAKITPPVKRIWTFYDQNLNYWNHYGELAMFTAKDIPYDESKPIYGKYKEKIFPLNPVHSAWPGILEKGKEGLDQPKMKDIYEMWNIHFADTSKYPLLNKIKDDNNDGIPEVNSPEEIDAFIISVKQHLLSIGYNLENREIVCVNNDRVYRNGEQYESLEKFEYESSPYASVYKYSHNIAKAKSALGIGGCIDCHSFESGFFTRQIVKYPFGVDGKPITEPQYVRMGIPAITVYLGIFREEYLKPIFYGTFIILLTSIAIFLSIKFLPNSLRRHLSHRRMLYYIVSAFVIILTLGIILQIKTGMIGYILPRGFSLDANHFLISLANMGIAIVALYFTNRNSNMRLTTKIIIILLGLSLISGFFMIIQFNAILPVVRYFYTLFDLCQVLLIISTSYAMIKKIYLTI